MISIYYLFEQDNETAEEQPQNTPKDQSAMGNMLFQKAILLRKQQQEQEASNAEAEAAAAAEQQDAEEDEAAHAAAEEEKKKMRIDAKKATLLAQDDDHQQTEAANQIASKMKTDNVANMAEKLVPRMAPKEEPQSPSEGRR